MLINWFTVAAQVVNFLILVWLMRRYLYRPILNAIDTRAKQVAGVLAEADKKMSNANQQLNVYQQKIKSFDDDRARRETQVDEEVNTERAKKMQSVEDDASAARQAEAGELRQKQLEFRSQLGHLIEQEMFATSQQAMTDLADASLEHQIVSVFMRRLAALDAASHAQLSDALKRAPCEATVTSSFALDEADRESLGKAVNIMAGANVTLAFGTSAATICGIELSCDGQRAAWSMADYLNGLSEKSASLLEENFPEAKTDIAAAGQRPAAAAKAAVAPEPAAGHQDAEVPKQEEHAS